MELSDDIHAQSLAGDEGNSSARQTNHQRGTRAADLSSAEGDILFHVLTASTPAAGKIAEVLISAKLLFPRYDFLEPRICRAKTQRNDRRAYCVTLTDKAFSRRRNRGNLQTVIQLVRKVSLTRNSPYSLGSFPRRKNLQVWGKWCFRKLKLALETALLLLVCASGALLLRRFGRSAQGDVFRKSCTWILIGSVLCGHMH